MIGKKRALDLGSGSGYFATLMTKLMQGGFVYSVNDNDKLTKLSIKNVGKNNFQILDDGQVIFVTGKTQHGLKEHSPYDVINIGYVIEDKVPRGILRQLAKGGRLVSPEICQHTHHTSTDLSPQEKGQAVPGHL